MIQKEERNHDEKMASANAKIKQAGKSVNRCRSASAHDGLKGQNYEKKTKKKAMDVSEDHARYITLISTLGPEMALEK